MCTDVVKILSKLQKLKVVETHVLGEQTPSSLPCASHLGERRRE